LPSHAVAGRSVGQAEAHARATALLAHAVQNQAYVPAFIGGFIILGYAVIGALLLILLLRNPPVGTLFRTPLRQGQRTLQPLNKGASHESPQKAAEHIRGPHR
jgi:hypothetical protein